MRLINCSTYKIESFLGDNVPSYAILSHTWDQEELGLQDMIDGGFEHKAGFQKLKLCCEQARRDGFKYSWVDTCCIDKTSSAELSEAINSMFRWYQESSVCYAFLSDAEGSLFNRENPSVCSRWFTRSWTLQEFLAPETVVFYDRNWNELGTRSSLAFSLTRITGIPTTVNLFHNHIMYCSTADKLSWAAERSATRIEDRAYSLMGLFNINMPLLYGEGNKAFVRLQKKIIKSSRDPSIFAWSRPATGPNTEAPEIDWLLAESLDDFKSLGLGEVREQRYHDQPEGENAVTGLGLPIRLTSNSIELDLPLQLEADKKEALAYLNCKLHGRRKHVCVRLFEVGKGSWLRHQEITILDKDAKYMLGAFQMTRIRLESGKVNFSLTWRQQVLPPVQKRMPILHISVSGNHAARNLQARIRYIADAQTKFSYQSLTEPSPPMLTYEVVTMDSPCWQMPTNMVVADLTFILTGTDYVGAVFRPQVEHMRSGELLNATIMVLDILDGDGVEMLMLAVKMGTTHHGSEMYIRAVPIEARDNIESLWDLDPPAGSTFDILNVVASREDTDRTYQISAKIRPRGCNFHDRCGCRPHQVSLHIEGKGNEPEQPFDVTQQRRLQARLIFTPVYLSTCNLTGFPRPGDPSPPVILQPVTDTSTGRVTTYSVMFPNVIHKKDDHTNSLTPFRRIHTT